MAGLTPTGFETKSVETIKAEIEAELRSRISPALNLAADSVIGQIVGTIASQLGQLWEVASETYASQYPDSANGFSLTSVAAITGTKREAATKSTVEATIDVDAGTYAIGDLVAHVAGDPTARFVNAVEVVSAGGTEDVMFESESTGPVRANAGTLTQIATPVSGWNSITNAVDAELGSDEESDSALRSRRETELAARGSTTADAIRVDILQLDGVDSAAVYVNDTDATDVNGLLPHSIEAVVEGGDQDEIAETIYLSKAAGINTNGSTTRTVVDSQNISHSIKFSRPTVKTVYLDIFVTVEGDTYGGDDAIKEALVDYGDETYAVGDDVILSKLVAVIFGVSGVLDVTSIEAGFSITPSGTTNLTVGVRELADLDTARITVTVVTV